MGAKKWIGLGVGVVALGGAVALAQYRNIEEPSYALVKSEGDFELRDYPEIVVAEVTHSGDRNAASGKSFRRLAAYIFAQDRPAGGEEIAMTAPVIMDQQSQANEEIAMTAPVLQDKAGEGEWRMRFVMPSKYTVDTLPPAPEDITLTTVPSRKIAAVRFSGTAPASELSKQESALRDWIEEQGPTAVADAEYAFYDAPMVPGPLRRNEVMIEVAAE